MPGTDISSIIGGIYEASSKGSDWFAVSSELFHLLGAESGSLRVRQVDGSLLNVLQPLQPLEREYARRFEAIDPVRAAALRVIPARDWGSAVRTGDELIDTSTFFQSDFFQNFAKPLGRNNLLLGTLGDADRTLVLLFRETVTFTDKDKQNLISFANTAAERMLAAAGSPLALKRQGGPAAVGARQVVVRNHNHAIRLRSMVADAARGGEGGAMRLEVDGGADDRLDQFGVFVTPRPLQRATQDAVFADRVGPVLVIIKELSRPSAPRASLLCDLFGLSIAEALSPWLCWAARPPKAWRGSAKCPWRRCAVRSALCCASPRLQTFATSSASVPCLRHFRAEVWPCCRHGRSPVLRMR